jgi:hypothetical protein
LHLYKFSHAIWQDQWQKKPLLDKLVVHAM